MKKPLSLILSLICISFSLGGCQGDNGNAMENDDIIVRESFIFDDIELESKGIINSFTIMGDNRAALLFMDNNTQKSCFGIYESNKPVTEKEIAAGYSDICYDKEEGCFYAFNSIEKEIHKMDNSFSYVSTVTKEPEAFEIRGMDVIDGSLYYIYCTKNTYDPNVQLEVLEESTGYCDFGEAAYCVDIGSGEKSPLEIEKPICQYASGGKLYYYTFSGESYYLNEYDRENNRLVSLYTDRDMSYISGFAVHSDTLYYIKWGDSVISKKDMKSGDAFYIPLDIVVCKGSDFKSYKSEPIILNRADMSIRKLSEAKYAESESFKFSGESLVIGYFYKYSMPIDTKKLNEDIGITASVYEYPIYDNEMKLKLLACDSDVDIYIFTTNRRIGRDIRRMGCYEPLANEAIIDELDDCFDWVREYSANDNGEIWCMPISANQQALFYVPENLERLGIDISELKSFESFWAALEKIRMDGRYGFFSRATQEFGEAMTASYNINYSFFDYDTDIFRNMFTRVYSDWLLWSNPAEGSAENPLFNNMNSSKKNISTENAAVIFDNLKLFRNDVTDCEKWCAMGIPNLTDSEEKYPVSIEFAIINPASKKKEAAEAYLGHIAQNRLKYRSTTPFFYKDLSTYDGCVDKSAAYFEGLYELSENSQVYDAFLEIKEDYLDDVAAYQKGEMTIDEYIANIERISEMTENE